MSDEKIRCESISIILLFIILLCLVFIYQLLFDNGNFLNFSGNTIISSYSEEESRSKGSWQIIVDLDQHSLFVYNDGILIREYPCSGGKDEMLSPVGEFNIISKDSWGEGFGGVWMGLNVPWGTYGIHGTKNPSIIGKENVSRGCIRMKTEDAKELEDLVPLETPVKIVQKNRPFFTRYKGDRGSEIWNSQIILYNLGYYHGEFDGKFGNQLYEAIMNFQKDNGLKETGSLNKKTYDKILEINRV